MVRVDIETIVMAAGPVPSLIVLRERSSKSDSPAPLRSLSIQTGSFEAAAISRGIDSGRAGVLRDDRRTGRWRGAQDRRPPQ